MNTYLSILNLILGETLWPTRCALCDALDTLLCPNCWQNLPFIDQYRTCPTCGAAFGKVICCECNSVSLELKGLKSIPLDACSSVFQATPETLKLITTYKDRGEQQLAPILALLMKPLINPAWPKDLILTTIPARNKALKERGFDHMMCIGKELSALTAIPLVSLLGQKESRDQRKLKAKQRVENKKNTFFVKEERIAPSVLLIDDVFTTGSTLYSAATTLKESGSTWVGGLTLARV